MTASAPGPERKTSPSSFHVMAKPAGPACNLACTYCFYLEKNALFPAHERFRMSPEMLEAYTRNYLESHPADVPVNFAWQGGEPTLLGLEFFQHAVELQQRYGAGRQIQNAFQTNGTLLDDAWCKFLARHHFLIGLSLDGPADVHDHYRLTKAGKPTHRQVVHGLKLLQKHRVDHNILACVNRYSSKHPLKVYRYFREMGVEFIQFIPIVERQPLGEPVAHGLKLSGPPAGRSATPTEPPAELPAAIPVTTWSVQPDDFGNFLTAIFDEWVRHDVGSVYVMNFEWALANFLGAGGTVCVHSPTCGRAVIVEHDGAVYACDHYVYPEYRLGNVTEKSFAEMVDSPEQTAFGQAKSAALTRHCRACPVLTLCWGDCPKHRFAAAPDGAPGLSYLCSGYQRYYQHLLPYLSAMGNLLRAGRSPAEIMRMNVPGTAPDRKSAPKP